MNSATKNILIALSVCTKPADHIECWIRGYFRVIISRLRPKPRSPSIDELAPLRVERHVNSRIGRIRRGIIARAIKLPAGRVPFTYEQHLELAAFRVRLT